MSQISIVVPVYKVELYIERCIKSILNQTFSDFELILVNDGSPDNSVSICESFAKVDKRITVIHQNNKGVSAARNTGIDWILKNSNSNWVTFVDSDDWIHPRYLELLYYAATEKKTDLSICRYYLAKREIINKMDGMVRMRKCHPEEFWLEDRTNAVVVWGKLYRKELFNHIRYPEGKLHEDEWVTYRMLFNNSQIAVIDENLYYYFLNEEGIMRSEWSPRRLDAIGAYKEQIEYFEKNGYIEASKHTISSYINNLVYSWNQLKLYPELVYEKKIVLKELRIVLCIYIKRIDILAPNNKVAYRIAYFSNYDNFKMNLSKKKKHIINLFKEEGFGGVWKKILSLLKV